MVGVVGTVTLLAGAILLIGAGFGHTRRPAALAAALAAQRLLPVGAQHGAARLLGPLEMALGVITVLTWLLAPDSLIVDASAVTVMLVYAVFAGYLLAVHRRSPGAPCGCFGADEPISGTTIGRAGLFAALPLGSFFAAGGTDQVVTLTGATLLAAVAAVLPGLLGLLSLGRP